MKIVAKPSNSTMRPKIFIAIVPNLASCALQKNVVIRQSRILNISKKRKLKVVFNFIVNMMELQ